MFEGQDIQEDAITVQAVTFHTKEGERVYIRTDMKTRVDDGFAVVNPIIKEQRKDAEFQRSLLIKPGWLDKKDKHEQYVKDLETINRQTANPLMDIPNPRGEQIVQTILEGLKNKGLKITKKTEHSNGEMIERKWIFQ